MLSKHGVESFREPRFVTELEGGHRSIGCPKRRDRKEADETLRISLEVRWKLEQKGAKLARLTHGFKRREELSEIIRAFLQTLEVGNTLWRLEAEPEVRRSRPQPAFEHLRRRQRTKRIVHLNRGEL